MKKTLKASEFSTPRVNRFPCLYNKGNFFSLTSTVVSPPMKIISDTFQSNKPKITMKIMRIETSIMNRRWQPPSAWRTRASKDSMSQNAMCIQPIWPFSFQPIYLKSQLCHPLVFTHVHSPSEELSHMDKEKRSSLIVCHQEVVHYSQLRETMSYFQIRLNIFVRALSGSMSPGWWPYQPLPCHLVLDLDDVFKHQQCVCN